jgi:hypothetical protein
MPATNARVGRLDAGIGRHALAAQLRVSAQSSCLFFCPFVWRADRPSGKAHRIPELSQSDIGIWTDFTCMATALIAT